MVKSAGRWVMCDDENIEPIDEKDIYRYFGDYPSGAGYVLFYQAVDLDLKDLGMKNPPKPTTPVAQAVRTVPTSVVVEEAPSPVVNGTGAANGAPILMDVQEEHEEAHVKPQPEVGTLPPVVPAVRADPPAEATAKAPTAAVSPPAPIAFIQPGASGTPRSYSQTSIANGAKSTPTERSVPDRQVGFTPTPTSTPPVHTDTSLKSKTQDSSRVLPKLTTKESDRETKRMSVNGPSPAQSRSTSANNVTTPVQKPATPAPAPALAPPIDPASTNAGRNGQAAPAPAPTPPRLIATPASNHSPNAMSSSVISNFSQSSSVGSSAPPPSSGTSGPASSYTAQSSLGRKPSTSASNRERNVSTSSNSGFSGGVGLGRRLSGMSGKFKMGFGKKSGGKDREGGIEEEDQKRSERKGLLG